MIGWALALGVLFAGYLLLAGYDYGVGMLSVLSGRARAETLDTLRPVLLRNEVWLVATVGVVAGAFTHAEELLLSGLYPLVVVALAGVVAVTAGVPLFWVARGRGQRVAGTIAAGGAVAAALGWGAVLGTLFVGLPWRIGAAPDQLALLTQPMTYVGALTMVALMVTHGATFLSLRAGGDVRQLAARIGQRSAPLSIGLLLVSAGCLAFVHMGQTGSEIVLLCVGIAALVAVRVWLRRNRLWSAFAASMVAMAVPIVALVAAHPGVLVASSVDPASGLTVAAAASGSSTLQTLTTFAVIAAPLMAASQLVSWWLFRTPVPRVRSGQ
ncbi:cytochrome d ubiquinol oxidase subunit II [Fodinicola feengrottensis]|uniref:Cytochrome d ubiquinol oxidase subunit II n=1 Tax=Fodinicola feengrottensis TaxID=435914 RepID=A0ABN2FTE7_9ACTN